MSSASFSRKIAWLCTCSKHSYGLSRILPATLDRCWRRFDGSKAFAPVSRTQTNSRRFPQRPPRLAPGRDSSIADRFAAGVNILTDERDVMAESLSVDKVSALEAIANHLFGLPGRKGIIWVTGSVPNPTPLAKPSLLEKYRHMVKMLNEADVSV